MTDGSLVTIPALVVAILAVSTLALATARSWRDGRRRTEPEGVRVTDAHIREKVRLLEERVASLTNELEALRGRHLVAHEGWQAPDPRRDPARQVAPHPSQPLGDPRERTGRVAAPANVIVFPRAAAERARR